MEISKDIIAVVQARDVEERVVLLPKPRHRQLQLCDVFKHWWEFDHFSLYLWHDYQKPQGIRVEGTKILNLSLIKTEVTNLITCLTLKCLEYFMSHS